MKRDAKNREHRHVLATLKKTEMSCQWDTGGDGHRRIMAKHGSPSDRPFPDFQCACTRGAGGMGGAVGSHINCKPIVFALGHRSGASLSSLTGLCAIWPR